MNVLSAHNKLARDKARFGFWIYIMTDCVLFASLFATYAVLHNNTAGGPDGKELFNLPFVLTETMILLTSSFTCGLGLLAALRGDKQRVLIWFMVTFLLGLTFLGMEMYEFNHILEHGSSWKTSAFLSSFFVLVGTHGIHITVGLIWIAVLVYGIRKNGLTEKKQNDLALLGMFWHFLDIVWIFIFTFVFLMGASA